MKLSTLFYENVRNTVPEDVRLLGGGKHCILNAYGIKTELINDIKVYFEIILQMMLKKAFLETQDQHRENKSWVECVGKFGPKGNIPEGFAYLYIDVDTGNYINSHP